MENQQAKDVTVAAFNLDTHTSKWGYPGRKSNTQVSVPKIESQTTKNQSARKIEPHVLLKVIFFHLTGKV